MGVTSFEETPDVSCLAVTPAGSKGALGTWRSQGGSRTLRRDQAALEAGTRSWVNQRVRGVRMSVLEPRRDLGKTCEGKPRSEPDWGNPTVRDRRGACGNVDHGGTRNPPRLSKERVLETLRLQSCAPQIYPDLRLQTLTFPRTRHQHMPMYSNTRQS